MNNTVTKARPKYIVDRFSFLPALNPKITNILGIYEGTRTVSTKCFNNISAFLLTFRN